LLIRQAAHWVKPRPVLTTRLYFPDEPRNREDDFFHPERVMRVATSEEMLQVRSTWCWPCACGLRLRPPRPLTPAKSAIPGNGAPMVTRN
jgi:hypothetical protein